MQFTLGYGACQSKKCGYFLYDQVLFLHPLLSLLRFYFLLRYKLYVSAYFSH